MKLKIFLTGMTVLFIVTVSGQGYNVKPIQNDGALLKSAPVAKQRLDSMITSGGISMTVKYEYIYDTDNIQTECNKYSWNNNCWKLTSKKKYLYGESGNLSKLIYTWYLGDNGPSSQETTYFYDAAGKLTGYIYSQVLTYNFIYDINGNLIGTWYSFDGKIYYPESISYNADRNPTEYKSLDATGTVVFQINFNYDTDGKIVKLILISNDEGYTSSDTLYCSYDSYGNPFNDISYTRNNNLRELYQKTGYTYDNTFSFSDLILPRLSDLELPLHYVGILPDRNMVTSRYFYHKLTGYKKNIEGYPDSETSVKFFYSNQIISSAGEINKEVTDLYPNPVSGNLYFKFPDTHCRVIFQLFDIRGGKVMDREITGIRQINVEDLKQGVYIYNLVTDGSRQCGKLIKY